MSQNILLDKVNIAIADVNNAYSAILQKGGLVPVNKNLPNLSDAIQSIPSSLVGPIVSLTDSIGIKPSANTYTKLVGSDASGYNPVTINSSMLIETYNVSINIDDYNNNDKIAKQHVNDNYVDKLSYNIYTKYLQLFEFSDRTVSNKLFFMSYKIPMGFLYSSQGIDNNVYVNDPTNFENFTTLAVLSNLNNLDQLSSKIKRVYYNYYDYEPDGKTVNYGYTSISGQDIEALIKPNYMLDDVIDTFIQIFENLQLSNGLDVNTFLKDDNDVRSFNKFRLVYNVNITFNEYDDVTYPILYTKHENPNKNRLKRRIDDIKLNYSGLTYIQEINDIIDEGNTRVSYIFTKNN